MAIAVSMDCILNSSEEQIRMNLSLDYDNTYTRDPEFWDVFIDIAKRRGHTVYVVTMRTPGEGEEVIKYLQHQVEAILFTSRRNKHDYCFDQRISIDVWIDDMPYFVMNDASDYSK
jgi:acid phosphatase class B